MDSTGRYEKFLGPRLYIWTYIFLMVTRTRSESLAKHFRNKLYSHTDVCKEENQNSKLSLCISMDRDEKDKENERTILISDISLVSKL